MDSLARVCYFERRNRSNESFQSLPVYHNVSISLPAIPLLFSIPFYIENRKKKKKEEKNRGSSGVPSNANIFAQIHLCIHCKIALDVDHVGGREQCDLSRFPWRPLIFAAQISAKSFPRSIRKMIRYYSLPIRLRAFPPILATIKRLSSQRRKCFDLDSFKSGFKGSKRI